jgi:short-chain fatty acids transporter
MVSARFHWALGLIVGAVSARAIGRQLHDRGVPAHYPLLCVAGYMGLGLTWHWGLSGSAPLLMNTPNNFFIGQGLVDGVLSPTLTVFHPYTLTLLVVTVLATLAILYALSPPEGRVKPISEYVDEDELSLHPPRRGDGAAGGPEPHGPSETVPADRVDRSRTVGGLVALGGITMTGLAFGLEGLGALRINTVNFGLLFIGLALYSAPDAYQEEFYDAVRSAAGVVLLFPFYAGIIGMMNLSGLSTTLSVWLLEFATAETLPAVTWLAAGFVNVFVPSGGAQWNLMGVEILERAQQLGVPPGKAVVAFGAGDAYTNLVQPFWAIPLLGITGIRARDLFGYAMAVMVLLGPVLAVALIAFPY